MTYYMNFGNLNNVDMNVVNKLLSDHDSDKGIGLHRIFDMRFDKLGADLPQRERDNIIGEYWEHSDNTFRNVDYREEQWVSDNRLNRNKGYSSRSINTEFIDEFKKIRGGREFFRSIKDEYTDNATHPNLEVCLINTPSFKSSIKTLAAEVVNNEDLTPEQIDFIKWVYWWGTQTLRRKGNRSSIRFSID
ncbi:MAG: hypothetical protein SLAVMIC_00524 [uncultured marine phage]|uniref:Uncharacterized protein n=1 Tax=uncultured marine phage TaxID=707152 RepID=A0A8D9FQA6_9VIRU|nr:MAG: hypothetical protein SLAVMIC_00524 [uncultured marine phage]